jgi:hypothetical protein
MESFEWVVGLLTVIFGIAGIANNNKKKREEQARSVAGRKPPGAGVGSDANPGMGSGWGSGWGADQAQPVATSHDYYSLEEEYDMADGRGYRGEYSAEESDAEQRYSGGELGGTGSVSGRFFSTTASGASDSGDPFEDEIAEYDRLAAWRTQRSSLAAPTAFATSETAATQAAHRTARPAVNSALDPTATDIAAMGDLSDMPEDDGSSATLRELLGGKFDLRRAIIETEILAPKYL